jgi:hypothetical protein
MADMRLEIAEELSKEARQSTGAFRGYNGMHSKATQAKK